jgi:putative spermidine/putrescine transport system permease protein
MKSPMRILVLALYLFLLAPIIVVFLSSFSNDAYLAFPPHRWGFGAYLGMLQNAGFRSGLEVSLILGAIVTLLSLLLGTAAAWALARSRIPAAGALLAFFTAPLLMPTIVLGLALLLVFSQLNLLGTLSGLVFAHTLVAMPFVVRLMLTAIRTVPPALEEAAATLGAPPATVFRRISLPLIHPALVAAAALAFLASFDEVVITLFVIGPRMTTLPVQVFQYVQYRADPQVSALSVALIAVTLALVLVIDRSTGLMRTVSR